MKDLVMPSLGADMEAGTLVEWLVQPGDHVERGDVIAVVETHKGAIDVESFDTGTVVELVAEPGTEVPVGSPIARLEGPPDDAPVEPPTPTPEEPPPPPAPPPAARTETRVRASPAARRRARELGVDLARVQGSGAGGEIGLRDVEHAAEGARPEPTDDGTRMRRAIAAVMARAKREIPHYYLGHHIDLLPLMQWLEQENARRSVVDRLLPAVPLLRAVALAAREVPELNGHYEDDAFRPSQEVHLGVAVSLRGGGLQAPAIRNAERLSLTELAHALRDVVNRARSGALRSSEVGQATLTVSSLGDRGVETLHGVIHPPQVALVGFGTIFRRPWAVGDRVEVRPVVHATLSADHRASDGHRGALFLAAVDRLLQTPEAL